MGGFSSKKKDVRTEVWREESVVENKLGQKADTWGGITSYNLLDIQVLIVDIQVLIFDIQVLILNIQVLILD